MDDGRSLTAFRRSGRRKETDEVLKLAVKKCTTVSGLNRFSKGKEQREPEEPPDYRETDSMRVRRQQAEHEAAGDVGSGRSSMPSGKF
jgi:hypothetical protein